MIKYFCDSCGKELTISNINHISIKYDVPLSQAKYTTKRNCNLDLCDNCLTKKIEDFEKIFKKG